MDEQKLLENEESNNGRDSKYLLTLITSVITFFVFYGIASYQAPNIIAAIIASVFTFATAQWILTLSNARFTRDANSNSKVYQDDFFNKTTDLCDPGDPSNFANPASPLYRNRFD